MIHYTPIERRIMGLLNDGQPHSRKELRDCVDDLATMGNLSTHLSRLRAKLVEENKTIGRVHISGCIHGYQLFAFVSNDNTPSISE